jgi:hypothetical protein
MAPTELSRYQETAWNDWIRRKPIPSELAPSETLRLSPGPNHFKCNPGNVGGLGHTEACPRKIKSSAPSSTAKPY